MKIIHKDFKKGVVKLRIDDNEDLWTIKKIISVGDIVSGSTTRVIKKEGREGQRKKVFLKIKVEKIEFMQAVFILKILGKIIEGPDDVPLGSYHSFNLEPGLKIIIEKDSWSPYEQKTLLKSERKALKLLITVLDSKEATHALLNKGVKELFTHNASLPRKDDPSRAKKVKDYYQEVIKQLKDLINNNKPEKIIIAGPGFAAEELLKVIKNQDKDLFGKIFKAHTNHTGMAGVKELINAGIISKVISDNEVSEESSIVEEFLQQVSKDRLVAYGLKEVSKAVTAGAVKTLIISEGLIIDLRERKRFKALEDIINMAEETKARVEFISTRHESGMQFYKFGGIGAILRYNYE